MYLAILWQKYASESPVIELVGWFLEFNGPLRQYFSLHRTVSQRRQREKRKDRREKKYPKNPTRTYCKRNRPLPYYHPKQGRPIGVGRGGVGGQGGGGQPPQ